jgi:hypothetical protein
MERDDVSLTCGRQFDNRALCITQRIGNPKACSRNERAAALVGHGDLDELRIHAGNCGFGHPLS